MLNQETIAAIAAQAEQADWDHDIEAALTRPTVRSLVELTTHPQRMEAANADLSAYSEGMRGANLQAAVSVASLLNKGKTDLALRYLHDRRKALRSSPGSQSDPRDMSGANGPQTTEVTDAMIAHIRSEDPKRLEMAKGLAGMVITTTLDPVDVAKVLARVGFEDDREDVEQDA